MELLLQLDEAAELELIDIQEDVLSFEEACFLIESDHKKLHQSALKFLTSFIDEIKKDQLGSTNGTLFKQKLNLFTVLSLLTKKQVKPVTDIPSIKKYMHSDSSITDDELDDADNVLRGALSKLHGDHNEAGSKVKDDYIGMLIDDKESFLKLAQSLKTKYSRMSRKI
jgi:hypothetical protein